MKMKRFTLILSLLMTFLMLPQAFAHGTDDNTTHPVQPQKQLSPREQVEFQLRMYHHIAPKEAFDRIPGARQIVESIALESRSALQRTAVAVLGYYPDQGTFQTFKFLLKEDKGQTPLTHQVLYTMGETFKTAQAVEVVKESLNHKDPQVRGSAVQALGAIGRDEILDILSKHMQHEKNDYVLHMIRRYGRIVR